MTTSLTHVPPQKLRSRDLQERVFEEIGLPREEYTAQFGHLLDCLSQGAPPHGGECPVQLLRFRG